MNYEKHLISEEKLDEGFMDMIMTGMGIGAGIVAFEFLLGLLVLLAAGGVITAVSLKGKIKDYFRGKKNDKGYKEATAWLKNSKTYKDLQDRMRANKALYKTASGKMPIMKELEKERMTIKRSLKAEVESDKKMSPEARNFIYDLVPGLFSTNSQG